MRWLRPSTRVEAARGCAQLSGTTLQIDGVKDVIAVASGRAGSGGSTTAVNLAVALANVCKLKVGLLDADAFGPFIPSMMKLDGKPEMSQGDLKIVPTENYGIKCMSMGYFVKKDAPYEWRVPMVMNAFEKMASKVDWGGLDILVMDMPPGTGYAQKSIAQRLQLSGALFISNPQDAELIRRGVDTFRNVEIPILGIIENKSCFKCPHCAEPWFIFGKGEVHKKTEDMRLDYLGDIPIEVEIRSTDKGIPVVISAPDSLVSKIYGDMAQKVVGKLKKLTEEELYPDFSPTNSAAYTRHSSYTMVDGPL
uniref:Iron-sulfur protein NUBPL n=1 Tax=Davidia involucrata TaxID=16924 RepID=A0A5B6ZE53_DAVIN